MATIISQSYLQELQAETGATRRCLERVSEKLYEFKPHEKSMAMGYLCLLVAEIPNWIAAMIKDSTIDLAIYPHFQLSTGDALLKHYDNNIKMAETALSNANDEKLASETFYLKSGGKELFSAPMLASIGSTINHWVHHRGQLTVYMRLNDIAVPSIYGPTADEKTFG